MEKVDLEFSTETSIGKVSAIFLRPPRVEASMILAHGAGAPMHHDHMNSLASALASQNIATFRFNFPYMQAGGRRTDSKPVCLSTIDAALHCLERILEDSFPSSPGPLLLGGHSFGGRMSSHYVAENPETVVTRLVYFSFPLHPSGKPGIKRAAHLQSIECPQLFVSGTRDKLAELPLLTEIVRDIPEATLKTLDTADHGFSILKRKRKVSVDVYDEAASEVKAWLSLG